MRWRNEALRNSSRGLCFVEACAPNRYTSKAAGIRPGCAYWLARFAPGDKTGKLATGEGFPCCEVCSQQVFQ